MKKNNHNKLFRLIGAFLFGATMLFGCNSPMVVGAQEDASRYINSDGGCGEVVVRNPKWSLKECRTSNKLVNIQLKDAQEVGRNCNISLADCERNNTYLMDQNNVLTQNQKAYEGKQTELHDLLTYSKGNITQCTTTNEELRSSNVALKNELQRCTQQGRLYINGTQHPYASEEWRPAQLVSGGAVGGAFGVAAFVGGAWMWKTLKTKNTEIKTKDGQITGLREQIEAQNTQITNKDEEIASKQKKVTKSLEDLESKDKEIGNLKDKIIPIEQENTKLQEQIITLKREKIEEKKKQNSLASKSAKSKTTSSLTGNDSKLSHKH